MVRSASSMQEPALQVQSNAAPAMQGTYNNVVGANCGSACGSACGCADSCGGQCGGRTGLRDRLLGGRGNDCNQWCPERYVTIFGGAATFNDIGFNVNTVDPAGAPSSFSTILNQNDGWTIGGGIGQRIRRRLRGEIEWSYRNATLNTAEIVVNNVPQANANLDGEINVYRSTSNLFFDFNPGGRFNAYFGGGVGVGFVDIDAQEPTTPVEARLQTSSFVYQGIVGMSARVKPCVEVFVDYRYSGTDRLELDANSPAGTLDMDVDITSNDIFVGLRIMR